MNLETIRKQRRYLIAIGSPECPDMKAPPLNRVSEDVKRIVAFFTGEKQGYEQALADEIPLGAPAQVIQDAIGQWFASSEREPSDLVLIYYAGHGDLAGNLNHHYLFTSDSNERELTRKAIKTSGLVELFFEGAGNRPLNILLLLDTCYSGKGGGQAVAAVAQAKENAFKGQGSGFWVIASAGPLDEAGDGSFVNAFLSVMEDDAWVPKRSGVEFINPLDLKDAINDWFEKKGLEQRAEGDVTGNRERHTFICNEAYKAGFDGLVLDDEGHWYPKARGVEGLASPGWFFTGRENALRKLISWLEAKPSDLKARVVTGRPGSGKSAVLARLVTCANKTIRTRMEEAGVLNNTPRDTVPNIGAIDAVVHAHGFSLERVVEALAQQLSIENQTVDGVLKYLAESPKPVRIVVDALDEANDPAALEHELLRKLAACPSARLIIGTRKYQNNLVPLAGICEIVDLDHPAYFSSDDIANYVTSRLRNRVPPTIYADPAREKDIIRIGQAIARAAKYSFLYARIVSRWLGQAEKPIDTSALDWEKELNLPEDLTQAFGKDLDRFDNATKKRFIDLLIPLAYAQGKGLPQKRMWATLASKISGRPYQNNDIRELKEKAGYYIIQDTQHGEAVYRLFHQSFAEYFKELTHGEEIDRLIVDALIEMTTPSGMTKPAWDQIHEPYILNNLPLHAAREQRLDDLVEDLGFLLNMPAESLLPAFNQLTNPSVRKIAECYRKAFHWLRSTDSSNRIPYLLLSALQNGADDLARKLRDLGTENPWQPFWVWWQRSTPHQFIVKLGQAVSALAVCELSPAEPVVIVGYGKILRVWDLITAREVGEPLEFDSRITQLLVMEAKGQKVIVTGWHDGTIRVLDLNSRKILYEQPHVHDKAVNALCVVNCGEELFVASGGEDENLYIWSIPGLQKIQERSHAHAGVITCLESVVLGETSILISGGDNYRAGEITDTSTIRTWNLPDLSLRMEMPWNSFVSAIKVVKIESREVLLVISYYGNYLKLFDLADGTLLADHAPHFPWFDQIICELPHATETVILAFGSGQFFNITVRPSSVPLSELPLYSFVVKCPRCGSAK